MSDPAKLREEWTDQLRRSIEAARKWEETGFAPARHHASALLVAASELLAQLESGSIVITRDAELWPDEAVETVAGAISLGILSGDSYLQHAVRILDALADSSKAPG